MKHVLTLIVVIAVIAGTGWADLTTNTITKSQSSGWTPIQFAIWDTPRWLHAFPTDMDIYGMRLGIPYAGIASNVYGVDIGIIPWVRHLTGMALGGFTSVKELTGIALGGFGILADEITGAGLGGCMVVAESKLTGVAIGGVSAFSERKLNGVAIGGLGAGGDEVTGVALGGFGTVANDALTGVCIGGMQTHAGNVRGIQCAGIWNTAKEVQGPQIACINHAWSGLQFGLLNFNKSGFLPVCPIFNFGLPASTDLAVVPYITDQAEWTAVQFSLFVPSKNRDIPCPYLYPPQTDVRGLQFGMPHSYNSNIYGLALGMISGCDSLAGVQLGALGTYAETVNGFQIGGIANVAKDVHGSQLALVNVAENGLQFGLLNFNKNGFLPFFPLVNFGWGNTNETNKADESVETEGEIVIELEKDALGRINNPDNGHWYKRFDSPMSWHAARDTCISNGGYLAVITSENENQFLYTNFAKEHVCWLGATEEGHTGTWEWVTNEPFEYQNWYPGEPNNYVPKEYYLVMGSRDDIIVDGEKHTYDFRDKWNDHQEDGMYSGQLITYPLCEWNE